MEEERAAAEAHAAELARQDEARRQAAERAQRAAEAAVLGQLAAAGLAEMIDRAAAASSGLASHHAFPSGDFEGVITWTLTTTDVDEAEVTLATAGDEITPREDVFQDRGNLFWAFELVFMVRRPVDVLDEAGEDVRYVVASYNGAAVKVGGGSDFEVWRIPIHTGWHRGSPARGSYALAAQTAIETVGRGAEAAFPDYDDTDAVWLDTVRAVLFYSPNGERPTSRRTKGRGQ